MYCFTSNYTDRMFDSYSKKDFLKDYDFHFNCRMFKSRYCVLYENLLSQTKTLHTFLWSRFVSQSSFFDLFTWFNLFRLTSLCNGSSLDISSLIELMFHFYATKLSLTYYECSFDCQFFSVRHDRFWSK